MGEYFTKVFNQITNFFSTLTAGKKVGMIATSGLITAGIAGLFMWAGDTSFAPLMTNLNPEDSANIIRILREKHIPFKADATGKNISIPSESLYELRLELATMGLPQSSIVGYEVFDKQSLGTTSFVQKVNQKRALEGELMRTIGTIRGVRRSRVHLALPQKSAFVEDQKKPTASVVVDLDAGTQLSDKQVYGIGNLVARAVEGLEIADVAIMDSNGRVLSRNPSDPLAAATATQLEYKDRVETDLEKRIESILSRVVGEGKVVAKVSAELDFSQVAETQTMVDADGAAMISNEKHDEKMTGTRPAPGGTPGAASNTPGQQQNGNEVHNDTSKIQELTNYEVPKTIRKTTRPSGTITRLSVAVVVDGKTVKTTDKDGKVLAKSEAWTPERLKELEDLVAGSVGLDRKRGDTLEIKNIEFSHEDFDEATRIITDREHRSYVTNMLIYGVVGILIVMFFMLVVRPFVKWITENTIDSVDTFLPQTIEELEKMHKNAVLPGMEEVAPILPEKVDPEKVEGEMLKEKIITLIDQNPHKAALILKDWLHGEAQKTKAEKEKKEDSGKGKSA